MLSINYVLAVTLEHQRDLRDLAGTFERQPGLYEAYAYEALDLILQLLVGGPSATPEQLREMLDNLHQYEGVNGTFRFDEAGNTTRRSLLLSVEGDKFVLIE